MNELPLTMHSGAASLLAKAAVASPVSGSASGLCASPSVRVPSAVRAEPDEIAAHRSRHRTAHTWVAFAVMGDFLMALLGSLLAFWVRFNTLQHVGHFTELELRQYIGHLMLGSVSLVAVLAWMGIYRRSMLLQPRKVNRLMLKGCLGWSAGFLLLVLTFQISPPISRIYMALNGVITFGLLLAWRLYFDARLHEPARWAVLQQRAILVGTGEDSAHLKQQFERSPESAIQVMGWVAADPAETSVASSVPCLGTVDRLDEILSEHAADMVVLSDIGGPRELTHQIAGVCEREMVQFKIVPSCFRIFVSGLQLENVAGTPLLGVSRLPLDSTLNVVLKRCVDIVGALVGLVLSAPLIAVFGGLVWLESRGPIFYRQRRTGVNGKSFDIFKIRSMKLNAEANGAQWCTADDPRRLRVGAFMRKWNIDEVPQFWNVLTGEMSLVGPRPERPELIANFKHKIPHYNARHHAKPGITGWAQVKGLRGDTDLTERIKADIWYLENWYMLLDFQIMFLTFFKRDNAY